MDPCVRPRQLRAGCRALPHDGAPERRRARPADGGGVGESVWLGTEENVAWSRRKTGAAARGCPRRQGGLVRRRAWSAPQERVSRLCPSRSNSGAYGTPPPRAREISEQGVCFYIACGIPVPIHSRGDK